MGNDEHDDVRRLAGRRATVTGAGSGIGRAIATRLAVEGAAVAVIDVRDGAAAETATAIVDAGGVAHAFAADVGDDGAMADVIGRAAGALGGIDAVIAAAGITFAAATHELSIEDWETMHRVNLTGTFLTVKHAVPHLLEAGAGTIVTIGSVASLVAGGQSSAYDSSKGGVLQFTRAIAVEYVDHGIRANCICPGLVRTGLGANSRVIAASAGTANRPRPPADRVEPPMGRFADPSEIAAAAAFLTADDSSFVTGVALPVDGGYTAI